ncbi:MAG: sodium:alanine symporter family protein [Pseudomonadota bacterium]
MEVLEHITGAAAGFIWGWPDTLPFLVGLLLVTGLFTTVALRFVQARYLMHSIDVLRGKYDDPEHAGDLSHFQALTTALSATVGIGNIAGVATALHYGGPGALFWMWVTAAFGMALKFHECTLSQRYRTILADGSAAGGPMYYIEQGLGPRWKPLAMAFAACAVVSSFGSGNAIQAFTVADQLRADLHVPTVVTGLVSASLVAAVILGGIKRIGAVTSKLVPWMAAIYIGGGLVVLGIHAAELPAILVEIVRAAFQPAAQIGGFAGGTFVFMLTWGVKRGIFSNESGQGSAPIAHAAAKTDEPVREGLVAMLGPLIDTLIICTVTGLVILATGAWTERVPDEVPVSAQSALTVVTDQGEVGVDGVVPEDELFSGALQVEAGRPLGGGFVRNHATVLQPQVLDEDGAPWSGTLAVTAGDIEMEGLPKLRLEGQMALNGSPLTAQAFRQGLSPLMGSWGHLIVTIGVVLFGISTAISWSYYGDRSVVYLVGPRWVMPYKIAFCAMHFLGAVVALEVVWNFGDAALGLMAIPNLLALILLWRQTRRMTLSYFERMRRG